MTDELPVAGAGCPFKGATFEAWLCLLEALFSILVRELMRTMQGKPSRDAEGHDGTRRRA